MLLADPGSRVYLRVQVMCECMRDYVRVSQARGNRASGYNYSDGCERTGSASHEICPWDDKTSQSPESIQNTCTRTLTHAKTYTCKVVCDKHLHRNQRIWKTQKGSRTCTTVHKNCKQAKTAATFT